MMNVVSRSYPLNCLVNHKINSQMSATKTYHAFFCWSTKSIVVLMRDCTVKLSFGIFTVQNRIIFVSWCVISTRKKGPQDPGQTKRDLIFRGIPQIITIGVMNPAILYKGMLLLLNTSQPFRASHLIQF